MDLTANPGVPGAVDATKPQPRTAAPPPPRTPAPPPAGDVEASVRHTRAGDGPPENLLELERYAEVLFTQLATDGTTPPPPATGLGIPGHWLAPAIEALTLVLAGEDALEPLSRAAQLDETRTALFLCLSLAISGHGDRVHASWLGTAFGELAADRPVAPGQRALWAAAARGAYGPAGKIFVLRRLDAAAVSSAAEPDRWLRALVPDPPSSATSPAIAALPALAEVPELAEPVQAAARLSRLLERCTEITSTHPPATARSERSGPRPDAEPLPVLLSLVGSGEAPAPRPLIDHLLDDIRPGADPHLAAIAFHVAAPVVRTAAEELATATETAPPAEITVPVLGHQVILRPEGPDVASLAAAETRIRAEETARRSGRWLVYVPALLPIAALMLAFTVSEVFAVVALVLGGLVGYLLWRQNAREQAEARRVEATATRLREQAEAAVWALHDYAREAADRAETATRDLTALTRLLRRGPAVADHRPPARR